MLIALFGFKLLWKRFFRVREFSIFHGFRIAPPNVLEVKIESAKDPVISRNIHYVQ